MRLHQNKSIKLKKNFLVRLCVHNIYEVTLYVFKQIFCRVRLPKSLRLSFRRTLPQPGSTSHNPAIYLILHVPLLFLYISFWEAFQTIIFVAYRGQV